MDTNNLFWTTATGKKRRFNKIGHQHLSNILWFNEVFNGLTWRNSRVMSLLEDELVKRHNRVKLPWKPLPIPNEIMWLKNAGMIDKDNNIVFHGTIIGTIRHIKNIK